MRTKNSITNIIVSLLYRIITIVSGFVISKILLSSYGSEINGYISSSKTINPSLDISQLPQCFLIELRPELVLVLLPFLLVALGFRGGLVDHPFHLLVQFFICHSAYLF